jgi:hypothetical protein
MLSATTYEPSRLLSIPQVGGLWGGSQQTQGACRDLAGAKGQPPTASDRTMMASNSMTLAVGRSMITGNIPVSPKPAAS